MSSPHGPAQRAGRMVDTRWQSWIAVIAALVLYVTLPDRLALGPRWIVPALEIALLVPLVLVAPRTDLATQSARRAIAIVLIAIINAANVASLVLLVELLISSTSKATGLQLLSSSGAIWFTNVIVFGLWYWELDRGGPQRRMSATERSADFLFPQMVTP